MSRSNANAARRPHFRSDGIHHATINNHRFHLRLSDSDHHHLWIDGRQPPLVLDQTAADFVTFIIEAMWRYQRGDGDQSEQVRNFVIQSMHRKYRRRVSTGRIRKDLDNIFGMLMDLANGGCPAEMGLDSKEIKYDEWNAPARMDLALTYRCNLKCGKCYVPDCQVSSELGTEDWLKIYGMLWQLGVPQVIFTGGEPTMREDLIRLVSEADEFVTGLITNGTRLADLAQQLKDASLDYVQVTIESLNPEVHDQMTATPGSHALTASGIEKAIEIGIETITNTTLTKANAPHFAQTVEWLHKELGINHIACNTLICSGKGTRYRPENGIDDRDLRPILEDACKMASRLGIELQWYSPTCYSAGINPIQLGLGTKSCSAAAHNMTIQPDGTVLPCQSWPEPVGNILTDDWSKIWMHPTCLKLRAHEFASSECSGCGWEGTCGGGCPLDKSSRQCSEGANQ